MVVDFSGLPETVAPDGMQLQAYHSKAKFTQNLAAAVEAEFV